MDIKGDVFKEFFKKLREDKEIPVSIVNELEKQLSEGNIISKENILEVIEKGCIDAGKN